MKITKKELRERTFVPYQLIIEVSSEDEHNQLGKDIYEIERKMPSSFRFTSKFNVVKDLFNQIKSHTK